MLMNMENANELKQTKLARELVGIENDAKHFIMNGKNADEIMKADAAMKFNTQVDEYVDKFDKRNERLSEYAKTVAENADDLEIMPISNNIIVKPFVENPFQRIKVTESGLIYDLGGQAPEYKSKETGEIEEEKSFIEVATVICAGPKCEYIQEGDTVMYTKPSSIPVPFFKQGLKMINEVRITAVINSGLTERFKNK